MRNLVTPCQKIRPAFLALFVSCFLLQCCGFESFRQIVSFQRYACRGKYVKQGVPPLTFYFKPLASTVYSGYIPPEMDPEYRKIASRQTRVEVNETILSLEAEKRFPIPSEGDVVQFKGKFGGPTYGKLRYLQYVDAYKTFFLDIIPLKQSKDPSVFTLDRNEKSLLLSINDVIPIKGYYSKRENGYRLAFDNSTNLNNYEVFAIPRAPRYRRLDKSFELQKKRVNTQVIQDDLQNYDRMKSRIALSSLQIGAIIALSIAWFLPNPDILLSYVLGVLGGCLYFYLLSFKVDAISSRYSVLNTIEYTLAMADKQKQAPGLLDPIVEINQTTPSYSFNGLVSPIPQTTLQSQVEGYIKGRLSSFRFLIPVVLILVMTGKNYYLDHDYEPQSFDFLPIHQYLGIMGGFLTLRISLFLNEVLSEVRGSDLFEVIPGSLAIALRKFFAQQQLQAAAEEEQEMLERKKKKIVMVSGPIAAGRQQLLRRLLSSSSSSALMRKEDPRITAVAPFPVYCSDPVTVDLDPLWYRYVNETELEDWRKKEQLFFEGSDRDRFGRSIQIYLKKEDFSRSSSLLKGNKRKEEVDQVYCLSGPPALMERVAKMDNIEKQLIWITQTNPETLTESAQRILQEQRAFERQEDQLTLPSLSELLEEATQDLRYYLDQTSFLPFVISSNNHYLSQTNESTLTLAPEEKQIEDILTSMKSF